MKTEPRNRRSRVCYQNAKINVSNSSRSHLSEKNEKLMLKDLQNYLDDGREWISVIRYRWIALSILLLRARLFFSAFLIIFVIYATVQYLFSNVSLELPLISLCLGIVFVACQNFILRSHEKVISEIFVDSELQFVKARYLTPWGVLRHRYATADTVVLTNYSSFDDGNETHLLWKETGWDGSLKIPINGVQIINQSLAMSFFGDLRI